MITKLRHVGIVVRDLEDSRNFYEKLLGLKVYKDSHEEGQFINEVLGLEKVRVQTVKLKTPEGGIVELLYYYSPLSPRINPRKIHETGITHLAVTVENLDQEYERLRQAGVMFNSPPKYSSDGYAKVAFCQDPDGNFIELVEVL